MRADRPWQLVALTLAALGTIAYPIPFQLQGTVYFQTVGFLILLNAMLGVGWNIIGGWAGQFDFGPNVFFALGAYVMTLLLIHVGLNPWLGMLAAVAFTALVSAIATYPITKLRGHYFAIATVAIWMIAVPIGATWDFINGSRGLFVPLEPRPTLLDQAIHLQFLGGTKELGYYYVALGLLALVLFLAHVVEHSKLGFYFKAIRDDQEAAEAIGVNSRLYKVLARSLTAAVFAIGGALYSQWALAVFPDQVLEIGWSTLPMIMVVVGGLGHLWGAILGALILIPISQAMSTYLGTGGLAGRGIDLIVYGIIIMLVAALRPNGLLSLPWGTWARRWLGSSAAPTRPTQEREREAERA